MRIRCARRERERERESAVLPRQGRLFWWAPSSVENKKTLPASHPELLARFVKEGSTSKAELFPDIDTMDIQARNEPLRVRGEPQMARWEKQGRTGFALERLCLSVYLLLRFNSRSFRRTH